MSATVVLQPLTAGQMLWHPNGHGHGGGPDPETLPLVDILAVLNLAGIRLQYP
jgi:hypothetical protein